jgi:uncharacterized phage protein (TIGR01671 family)
MEPYNLRVRAFCKHKKKMLYQDWNSFRNWYDDHHLGFAVIERDFPHEKTDLSEPMLFTGLEDTVGKPIYEGDILQITVYNIKQMYERGSIHQYIPAKVVYNEHFGTLGLETKDGTVGNRKIFTSFHSFVDFNIRSKEYEWKILGNMYENPELLEKYEKNII